MRYMLYIAKLSAFLALFACGTIFATLPSQESSLPETSWEMREYVCDVGDFTYKTIEAILSVPIDEQTFDNTLKSWCKLSSKLSQTLNMLSKFIESQSPLASLADQSCNDLCTLSLEISQNPILYQTLLAYSKKALNDSSLNPFQHHLASCFLAKDFGSPLNIQGEIREKQSSCKRFTVLNLEDLSLLKNNTPSVSPDIYLSDADIVCINGVFDEDTAYQAYEALQHNYAYFVYINSDLSLSKIPQETSSGSILIASKHPLAMDKINAAEKFFSFVIGDGIKSLAHCYVSYAKTSDESKVLQMFQKMQNDAFSTTIRIPVLLFGRISQELQPLTNHYCLYHPTKSSLGLYHFPSLDNEEVPYLSTYISSLTTPYGKLTAIEVEKSFQLLKGLSLEQYDLVLCEGAVTVSATKDSDGSKSVEASVSSSTSTENGGSVSVGVSGSVSQDSGGNTSSSVTATATLKF